MAAVKSEKYGRVIGVRAARKFPICISNFPHASAIAAMFGGAIDAKETVQKCRIVWDNRNFPTAASANRGTVGKTIPANRMGSNAQTSSTLTDRHRTGAVSASRGSNGRMAQFLANRSLIGSTAHRFSIVLEGRTTRPVSVGLAIRGQIRPVNGNKTGSTVRAWRTVMGNSFRLPAVSATVAMFGKGGCACFRHFHLTARKLPTAME
jgi:hypothetical protein